MDGAAGWLAGMGNVSAVQNYGSNGWKGDEWHGGCGEDGGVRLVAGWFGWMRGVCGF